MENQKQLLITGALGSLGEAVIELLIQDNWHIFATDNKAEILTKYNNHKNITPLLLNVTDTDSIKNTFEFVSKKTENLDAIIHLAGILIVGSMVELSIDKIQQILHVNLLGVYQINKTFLPLILNAKGRIVIISSETGKQTAAPFNGAYALSKHALEAYTDALRRELAFYNIKVIKFQPGAFKTNMTKGIENLFLEAAASSKLFQKNITKGRSYLPKVYKNAHKPIYLAKKIRKVLKTKNPKANYPIKQDALRNILDILPLNWADKLIKKALS